MRKFQFLILFILLLVVAPAHAAVKKADFIVVFKSERTLYLLNGRDVIGKYRVSFGGNPFGHKQIRGDKRTPEGKYVLDLKNPDSKFFKSIRISYPNERDKAVAAMNGVDPGDNIFIHGQKNGKGWLWFFKQNRNWTDGCIAMRDSDMEEVWEMVDVPTGIEILP